LQEFLSISIIYIGMVCFRAHSASERSMLQLLSTWRQMRCWTSCSAVCVSVLLIYYHIQFMLNQGVLASEGWWEAWRPSPKVHPGALSGQRRGWKTPKRQCTWRCTASVCVVCLCVLCVGLVVSTCQVIG